MKKIVCFGASFSGNRGASAMLESVIENISREHPGSFFYVFSPFPDIDRRENRYSNVKVFSGSPLSLLYKLVPLSFVWWIFNKLNFSLIIGQDVRIIRDCDIVLDLSGISFSDGRELFLPFNILSVLPALFLKRKVLKCSQALGDFNHFFNRIAAKIILPRLYLIVARGRRTKEFLNKLHLSNTIKGADLAFSLVNHPGIISRKVKEESFGQRFCKKKIVGISPSSVVEKNCSNANVDYRATIVDFILYLIEHGFSILIVPHSLSGQKDSSSGRPKGFYDLIRQPSGDTAICKDICRKVNNVEFCKLVESESSSKDLRGIIGLCDYYVASRFHSMVSALVMKVPVLVCGWGHKYQEVLEAFGLADYGFNYKDININLLINKFFKLVADKRCIKTKIDGTLPAVVASSRKYIEYI